MQFSALNSDSNLDGISNEECPNSSDAVSSTREAIESEAFKLYYRGLSLQQEGQLIEAREVLTSVLGSSYLTHSLQETDKKIPNELLKGKAAQLKLASLRNLSCIAEQRESWREGMSCCGQALSIDDTDTMLWYRLGRVSLRILELEISAYALKQTISRAPYLSPARKSLIAVLYAIYRYDECLLQCSELLRVCPLSQLGVDFANWILKSLPYTEPPSTRPIDSLRQKLDSVSSADLDASPHLQYGNQLRLKQKIAYPVNPPLEEWSPLSRLSSLCWTDLGAYLLSVFREAEAAASTLWACRVLGADGDLSQEEVFGSARGEEGERKSNKRRAPDLLDETFGLKRRSLRSSQQENRNSETLNKNLSDLVSAFFVPRWDYFQGPHCMSEHPSRPKKVSPPLVDPKLLLRSVSSVDGEEEKVRDFLYSHNLSPICSLLLRYLESSSQLFMLSWSPSSSHRLHSTISQIYLICHGRFMTLPNNPSTSSNLDTVYIVLMFIEIMVHLYVSSHSEEDPLLSQKVLEAAHFLEQVCYSPILPSKDWYTFFIRSSWSLSLFAEHRGLSDKQLTLLDHAIQALDLYNLQQETAPTQNSQSDSSSSFDGFSLEYPPDDLTILHPNIHTVINKCLLQTAADKAMTSNSIDRGILFDYFLKGDTQLLIDAIKPFVANTPSPSFGFLLVPMETASESDVKPSLLQAALECVISSQMGDSETVSLLNKIISKLVLSISDSLEVTNDFSELETELVTLGDVIEVFVCKQKQSLLTLIESADGVEFIWSLLKILQFYWDMRGSPLRKLLPISPTVALLFTCIQSHTQSADPSADRVTLESIHGVSSISESTHDSTDARVLLAQRRLFKINPGLGFLFECHDLFGSDHLCSSHQAMLLHLLLEETSRTLAGLRAKDVCLRELLESELTQVLFCLFGYPAKKCRTLGLSEHREYDDLFPAFHWPSCYIMLCNLFPSSLPTFDDNRSTGISPDLTAVCKRLADQLPYREFTVITQEDLEAFIQTEADSFPEEFLVCLCSQEAECLAMAYYVIADDFLKSHSNKAVDFYTRHLLFYPTDPDSWAGLTLAYFRKLKYMLGDRTVTDSSLHVSEVRECMQCVSRCFRQANRLYPSHSQLLERYGHFCFHVNSFWQHTYTVAVSNRDTRTELNSSLSVFQKALDFDTQIAEPWLYHYLLAKIKWKLLYPLEESFSHLVLSARILQTDGACYPDYIDCNSPRSAIQAIEVHYVLHSMFVKSLFRDKMAAVPSVETALISLKEATPLSRAAFPDTTVTQCIYENRISILQLLNTHQDTKWHHSLEERFITVLVDSIHGLLVCLARFPSHYKSHYRLTKTLWDLNPEVFYTAVKSLLVGPVSSSDVTNDKQLPLFNLRANLFSNMWVYDKHWDIERPGSFVYHMRRHVSLLFSFLSYRHSAEALLSTLSLLKLKPDPAKTYLREYERVQLYQEGLGIASQALESLYSLALFGVKPLHFLKASYILRSFVLKSSLAATDRDQLVARLDGILLKYYQLHRGEGEHSLDRVLSHCAQLTSPSEQAPHAKKPKQAKPKPLPAT